MKRRVKELVAVLVALVVCVGSYGHFTRLQVKNTAPSVNRTAGMENYVPGEKLTDLMEMDQLLPGISHGWKIKRHYSDKVTVMGSTTTIGANDNGFDLELMVKNETEKELSGLRMFATLPVEAGAEEVVADTVRFQCWLEYGDKKVGTRLDMAGENGPILCRFDYPGAIVEKEKEGGEMSLDSRDFDSVADYWRDEGLELNVPAGEEWIITLSFTARPIYDIEAETTLTDIKTGETGSEFFKRAVFGESTREFHVKTKVAYHDDIPNPVSYWVDFTKGIELVPGSVKVDGKAVDDLIEQEYIHASGLADLEGEVEYFETHTAFKELQIMETAQAGTESIVEYDVRVSANTDTAYVRSTIDGSNRIIGTSVKCRITDMMWQWCAMIIVAAVSIRWIVDLVWKIDGGEKEGSEK